MMEKCGVAVAALVLSACAVLGQTASKPEDRCTVQGRVINRITGEPVKKATVHLRNETLAGVSNKGSPPGHGYASTTAADGTFSFENIEPGDYGLSAERTGYLAGEYGAKGVNQPGSTITLRPGQQLTNIAFPMTPQAVISGKMVDQDGDPVEGAMVQLLAQSWERGKQQYRPQNGSQTNDLGEYRIANVTPGRYYLVVQSQRFKMDLETTAEPGKQDLRPAKTYYPEAANLKSATPIDVKAGQDLSGMDVRQRTTATYHIRGKVIGAPPDGGTDRLMVNLSASDEEDVMWGFGGGSGVNKDRSFDIAGVAPGSYSLNLFAGGRRGQGRTLAHQDVDVGPADVNDLQLAIVPPGTLRGQIILEGTPPAGTTPANLTNLQIWLSGAGRGTMMMMFGNEPAQVNEDGTFIIDNVTAGKYYLNTHAPSGTYLKSVRLGSQELLGKELELGQGGGQATLVFSYGVAEVDGTVQFPDSAASTTEASTSAQPVTTPDASIVLVPDMLNEDGSGMYFGSSRGGSAFAIRQLPPGHYRAYAFEKIDYGQLQNPNLLKQLESKGTDVNLKPGDKKQIQLPLISEEDMRQIYAQLGIEITQQ